MIKNLLFRPCLCIGLIAILVSLSYVGIAQSIKRQSISPYGAAAVSDHILIRQTAGQSYNTIVTNNGVTVSPGFQQPSSFALEAVPDPLVSSLDISVFPNPASRSITIASKEEIVSTLIQVTDIQGRTLLIEKVPNLLQHQIDCTTWVNGVYLITISDTSQNKKTLRLMISK